MTRPPEHGADTTAGRLLMLDVVFVAAMVLLTAQERDWLGPLRPDRLAGRLIASELT